MQHFTVFVFITASIFSLALGEICKDPKVDARSYTTTDGMVISEVAFIAEFTVKCNPQKDGYVLFADKNGVQIPAVRSLDNTKYQISWTENADALFSGDHSVRVYDEEDYAAVKKAHLNNEDVSSLPSAFSLSLYHRGTYYGPWVSTEFIAATTSILLWYIAFSSRSNLMAS